LDVTPSHAFAARSDAHFPSTLNPPPSTL
jgi:hypothetical protein